MCKKKNYIYLFSNVSFFSKCYRLFWSISISKSEIIYILLHDYELYNILWLNFLQKNTWALFQSKLGPIFKMISWLPLYIEIILFQEQVQALMKWITAFVLPFEIIPRWFILIGSWSQRFPRYLSSAQLCCSLKHAKTSSCRGSFH